MLQRGSDAAGQGVRFIPSKEDVEGTLGYLGDTAEETQKEGVGICPHVTWPNESPWAQMIPCGWKELEHVSSTQHTHCIPGTELRASHTH